VNLISVFQYSGNFFLNHVMMSEYQAVSSQTTQTLISLGHFGLLLLERLER
jgi:hypothetical protein